MKATQTDRNFTLKVDSLGENDLLCTGFVGSGGLAQLYHFELATIS